MPETPAPVVALLRGVNVAGRSKLAMADLRAVLTAAGLGEARTHLQSGNVILTPASGNLAGLSTAIEIAIADGCGLGIRVIVRTREQLEAIVEGNPFLEPGTKPVTLHSVFLESVPESDRVSGLDPDRSPPDRFSVAGQNIYVHYPGGSGRSKLGLDYFEKKLGVAGTARNWNTVISLLGMLQE